MNIRAASVVLSMVLAATAAAQNPTSLTRSEVAAIKAKIVAVQEAMGEEPDGYIRKEADTFYLPTEFNPAQNGKFWPITSSVQTRFTDRGSVEGAANVEQLQQDFMAKYADALASGDVELIEKMLEEMTQLQGAVMAAAVTPPARKDDMQVYVQLNSNPSTGIDPDAVVLERPGVIALRRKDDVSGMKGQVTVYLDPVALAATEELARIELRTADDGVSSRSGVFHIVIQIDGALADIESWVANFDFPAMLAAIDPR